MLTRYAGSCHCGDVIPRDRFRLEGIDLSGLPKKQFNGRAL
jgi:hypothetical protein